VLSLLASHQDADGEKFIDSMPEIFNLFSKWESIKEQILDQKYRIDKEIAQDKIGMLCYGTTIEKEKPVLLKIIFPDPARFNTFIDIFNRCAKTVSILEHPNIAKIVDFNSTVINGESIAYLVIEGLEGRALREVIDENGLFSLSEALQIVDQICLAIEEIHSKNLQHGNLTLDCIWLERRADKYKVKVLNTGLNEISEFTSLMGGFNLDISKLLSKPIENGSNNSSNGSNGSNGNNGSNAVIAEVDSSKEDRKDQPTQSLEIKSEIATTGQNRETVENSDTYSIAVALYEMLTGISPYIKDESIIKENLKDVPLKIANILIPILLENKILLTPSEFAKQLKG
jgi:serine/threonine protein kinase